MISKVSVIVPCFNQAQYLTEAVESVINQSYQNWECIIVNDGSPDNTEEVSRALEKVDSRVKYLYKENGGLADARNFGIKHATGIYILPLDCDDKIGKKYIEKAVEVLDCNEKVQIVYANAEFFDGKVGRWVPPDYSYEQLLSYNTIYCSAFFRKDVYFKTGGYNTNMIYGYEDWDFWLSLLKPEDEVVKLSEVYFYYRQKQQSMIVELKDNREKKIKMQEQIYLNHKEIYDNYISENGGIISILEQLYIAKYSRLHKLIRKVSKIFGLFTKK